MAQVDVAVTGLLQAAQDHRGEGLGATPLTGDRGRHLTADLPHRLGRVGGLQRIGQGRGRHLQVGQTVGQEGDPARVGALVDPVQRRDAAPLQGRGDLLVGQHHQALDQAMRLGIGHGDRGLHVPFRVEAEVGLGGRDLKRLGAATLGQHRGDLAGQRQRLGDRLGRALAAGEDAVQLVVIQAVIRAHQRAVEGDLGDLPLGVDQHLGGHPGPDIAGRQAAGAGAERVGQHRLDHAGHRGAVAAPQGLAIERALRPDVGGHVGDMNPDADRITLATGRHRIVEVARGGRIDGERGQLGQVAARPRVGGHLIGHRLGLAFQLAAETDPAEPVPEQRLDHVPGHIGPSQGPHDPRPARPELDQGQLPGPGSLRSLAPVKRHRRAGLEDRLGHPHPTAPADHRHLPPVALHDAAGAISSRRT